MTNVFPPVLPDPDEAAEADDVAVKETDGDVVLDPDVNDDLVDSATADRLATDPDALDDEL